MDEHTNIVNFRLTRLEEALDKHILEISGKLDTLLAMQGKHQTETAVNRTQQEVVEKRLGELISRIEKIEKDTVSLHIGLAEKLGPAAIVSGVVSLLVWLGKAMIGS